MKKNPRNNTSIKQSTKELQSKQSFSSANQSKKSLVNQSQPHSKKQEFVMAVKKSLRALWQAFPMVLGIIVLLGLIKVFVPPTFFSSLFQNNVFLDPFIGATFGSILAGNPVTSYIFGGSLMHQGVSMLAITAFLVAWVTVGVVSFPAEAMLLGRRFAIVRNISSYFSSFIVAILVVLLLGGVF